MFISARLPWSAELKPKTTHAVSFSDVSPRHFVTEVGQGTIDFKKIFAAAQKAGVKHCFVEQDETPASPFASIKLRMDYLKRLEF
jgi:sugar phosphate isomerase/epimerase